MQPTINALAHYLGITPAELARRAQQWHTPTSTPLCDDGGPRVDHCTPGQLGMLAALEGVPEGTVGRLGLSWPSPRAGIPWLRVGRRLRLRRIEAGHTRRDLARRLEAWHQRVTMVEDGHVAPSDSLVRAWLAACGGGELEGYAEAQAGGRPATWWEPGDAERGLLAAAVEHGDDLAVQAIRQAITRRGAAEWGVHPSTARRWIREWARRLAA